MWSAGSLHSRHGMAHGATNVGLRKCGFVTVTGRYLWGLRMAVDTNHARKEDGFSVAESQGTMLPAIVLVRPTLDR